MTSKPPFGGEVVRLGELIESSKAKNKDGLFADVYSVTNSHGFVPSQEYFNKEVYSKELRTYRVVHRNMIAYNPSRINVGSVAVQDKVDNAIVSPLYVVFSADETKVIPGYLVRFLRSKPGLDQIAQQSIGTVRSNLKFDALCKMQMPLPSLQAQVERMNKLTLVEQLADDCEHYLFHLDELVKSRFVEMFGTLEHPRYTIVELQDICAYIVDCPHETPKYDGMLEYPAIRTSELVGTTIDWSSMKYVSEEEYQRRTRRLIPQPGDIVYAREGTYGSAAILPDGYRFCLGQRTMLFRADASVCLPQYLLFAITSPDVKGQADLLNVGSTVPHVNVKDAKRFRIPLPSLALQREFADFATRVDKLRVEAQVQKEKLQTLYDSLAQDYFAI